MPRSTQSTEANKTGSWRFLRPRYEEKTSPCSAACPAGEDIARIEMLTAQGLFKEAWETILRENPFPGVCGRVCFHPCEGACNRREFDDAIAIHTLERFLADTAERDELKPVLEKAPRTARKGGHRRRRSGGAGGGLVSFQLGYACEVFEASAEAGGVLRWGIPLYRLPLAALRQEIAQIEAQGVRIHTGRPVTADFLTDLRKILRRRLSRLRSWPRRRRLRTRRRAGRGRRRARFPRESPRGEKPPCPGVSAVIGGGNTAIDVARSVVRLGGKALILYRRRRQDMPAFGEEVEMALEEGVELQELVAPRQCRRRRRALPRHPAGR